MTALSKPGFALLAGLIAGTVATAVFDRPLRRRSNELDAQIAPLDRRLRELAPVKAQVEAYQASRERLNAQVTWIEKMRSARLCPGTLIAEIDPERTGGARIEELALEDRSLVMAGTSDSPPSTERLASLLRGGSWARDVKAGTTGGPGAGRPGRFGLFATVEVPACPAIETTASPSGGQ